MKNTQEKTNNKDWDTIGVLTHVDFLNLKVSYIDILKQASIFF